MDRDQQDLRRASARAFFESLDQMNELARAQEKSQNAKPNPQSTANTPVRQKKPKATFSFAELEDAIADIEQFMQSREKQSPESQE